MLKTIKSKFYFLAFMPCMIAASDVAPQADIFPFAKNPELSWNQFEQDFRKNCAHLNVPPFLLIKDGAAIDLDFGPAVLVHEADEQWNNFVSKNSVDYTPPVIMIDAREITSPALTGYALWHEIGHHYYDPAVQKQKRENAALVRGGTALALLAGNAAYLYHNCKGIWNRNFTLKKGLIQASFLGLLLFKDEIFGQYINNFMVIRSDEYFADGFANQHATVEMLRAAEHDFSLQGCIEKRIAKETLKEEWVEMSPEKQQMTKNIIVSVYSAFYFLLDKFDITAHPSNKKRHAMVQQALKDRFGVEA